MVFARNLRLETKVIEFSQTKTLMYNIFFLVYDYKTHLTEFDYHNNNDKNKKNISS